MDAPGFPDGPESPAVLFLLWGLLLLLVAASVVVTVVSARRGPRRTAVLCIGALLIVAGGLAALIMWLPAYAFDSVTGGGTCPLDAIGLAFMRGDKASRFYAYWQLLPGCVPADGGAGARRLRAPRRCRRADPAPHLPTPCVMGCRSRSPVATV